MAERMEADPGCLFFEEHVERYRFALAYLRRAPFLDVACGTAYGTQLLRREAGVSVLGIDRSHSAVREARRRYPDREIHFVVSDGTALPLVDACFSNVLALETLEHIADGDAFVREIARVMHDRGVCVLSTPIRDYSESHGIFNPFHLHEYPEEELTRLLRRHFGEVDLFRQGFRSQYHDRVRAHRDQIRDRKIRLNPLLRAAIDNLYGPIKKTVPAAVANYFIRVLLGLSYPQPAAQDIAISRDPVDDANTFVAVCRQPLRRVENRERRIAK